MIQPPREAIQVARKIAASFYGALHVEPDDRKILDIAAALEAYGAALEVYATARLAQVERERDVTLARAQAAEAEAARWKAQFESTAEERILGYERDTAVLNTARLAAEERVRVLEAAIYKSRLEITSALGDASCHDNRDMDYECAFPRIKAAVAALATPGKNTEGA